MKVSGVGCQGKEMLDTETLYETTFDECGLRPIGAYAYAPVGSRPPARRGHRGLRPGGNVASGP